MGRPVPCMTALLQLVCECECVWVSKGILQKVLSVKVEKDCINVHLPFIIHVLCLLSFFQPGSRVLSLGRSTSIGTSVCCFPESPWRWTAVLPTSSSPSQSPPLTHRSLHAAEARLLPPPPKLQSHLNASVRLLTQPMAGGESSEREAILKMAVNKNQLACAQNPKFHPLCHPELTKGAAKMLGDSSEMKFCSLSSARPWIREFGSKVAVIVYVSVPVLMVKKALTVAIGNSSSSIPSSVWQESKDQ